MTTKKQNNPTQKNLKYCVAVKLVDFDPSKQGPRSIIFDGKIAIRLKGRVYTKI